LFCLILVFELLSFFCSTITPLIEKSHLIRVLCITSPIKLNRQDITEILLKVALNIITPIPHNTVVKTRRT